MAFLNADVGESYHHWQLGQDDQLIPLLSQGGVNIACGFHGGDALTMQRTLTLAKHHRCRIGAHPGYHDLIGFGRRTQSVSVTQLTADLLYQLGALMGLAKAQGVAIDYIKLHGALYHDAFYHQHNHIQQALVSAWQAVLPDALLMVPMGFDWQTLPMPNRHRQQFLIEAFADRRYLPNGQLMPRSVTHSSITEPQQAVDQVMNAAHQGIPAWDRAGNPQGYLATTAIDSWCIHGDNPQAAALAQAVSQVLGH